MRIKLSSHSHPDRTGSSDSKEYKETLLNIDRTLSQLRDQTLTILDLSHARQIDEKKAPELKCSLEGHTGGKALAFLEDGSLVSGSKDRTIKRWDLKTGNCLTTMSGNIDNSVNFLAVLADGTIVSASGGYGSINHWDPKTGECLATFSGGNESITALAMLADGCVASASSTIKCWDIKSGICLATLDSTAYNFIVLPNGSLLIVDGFFVKLWDLNTDVCLPLAKLELIAHGHYAIAGLSEDNLIIVTSNYKNMCLKQLDLKSGKYLATHDLDSSIGCIIKCAAIINDGNIIIGSIDGFSLCNLKTGACFRCLKIEYHLDSLLVLPDDSLVSKDSGGNIQYWHFARRFLTLTEIITLLEGMKLNHSVTHLNLCNVTLDGKAVPLLLELVRTHPTLTYLDLRNTGLTTAQLDTVIAAAKKRVTKLDVLCGVAPIETVEQTPESHHPVALTETSKSKMESKKQDERKETLIDIDAVLNRLLTNTLTTLDISHASRIDEKAMLQSDNTLEGHSDHVTALLALSDGSLVSGSRDMTIKHWDLKTGICLATLVVVPFFKGHTTGVQVLVELADGSLVSGTEDSMVGHWDLKKGVCLSTFSAQSSVIYSIVALPDGSIATAAFSDKTIKRWDLKSGKCLTTLSGHSDTVCCLAVLPDGNLISSSFDRTIKRWDLKTGTCLATFDIRDCPREIKVLADGSLVFVGKSYGGGTTLELCDLKTNTRHSCINIHPSKHATQLPDGTFVSGTLGAIRRWDIKAGTCLNTLSIPIPQPWTGRYSGDIAVTTLHDGSFITSLVDKTIKRWHYPQRALTTIEVITLLHGMKNNRSVMCVNLRDVTLEEMAIPVLLDLVIHHPTLTHLDLRNTHLTMAQLASLLTAAKERTVKLEVLCDEPTTASQLRDSLHPIADTKPSIKSTLTLMQIIKTAPESTDSKEHKDFLDIYKTLNQLQTHALTTLELSYAHCIDQKPRLESTLEGAVYARIHAMVILADGTLVCGSSDFTIKRWDLKTGAYLSTLRGHTDTIYSLLVLPDGSLVSGSQDKTIRHWDLKSETCLTTLKDTGSVRAFAVLADGSLVSCSSSGIKHWDLKSGECMVEFNQGHYRTPRDYKSFSVTPTYALAVLADSTVFNGCSDNKINCWDIKNIKKHGAYPLKTLPGHENVIYALLALADGTLVSASYDKTIKHWDPKSGTCLATLCGHTGYVYALAVLPDGTLVSGSHDTTIKRWDLKTGRCLATINEHRNVVSALAVSTDGSLISCSWDKTIRLWDFFAQRPLELTEIITLLEGMKTNRSVTRLNLSNLTLEEKVLPILLELVMHHPALKELDVRNTHLTAAQLSPVLAAAKKRTMKLEILSDSLIETVTTQAIIAEQSKEEKQADKKINKKDENPLLSASFIIPYDQLKLGKELGRGGFGIVYQATWRHTEVAVKQLLMTDLSSDAVEEFKKESTIMAGLRSPHIVQFYGCCVSPKYSLIMEYMPKGSLYRFLHSKEILDWPLRYRIITDIACGLAFLHTDEILHRDLKSLNILLDEHFRAKLSDFGLSKVKSETRSTSTKAGGAVGTLAWMAPELFKRKAICTKQTDIYSLGMTLWEIASRKLPFEDAHGNQALIQNWIVQGERDEIPADCPKKIASLIRFCWQEKPERRPSADQIVLYLRSEQTEFTGSEAASIQQNLASMANSSETIQGNLMSDPRI